MCGRYAIYDIENLSRRFEVDDSALLAKLKQNYNAAPSQTLPVVIQEAKSRQLDAFRWGLIPFWAKESSIGYKMINARSETIFSKPAWRGAIRHHRCLIPANGFYEWQKQDSGKQPYFIHPQDQDLFALAGIADSWTDKASGEVIRSFSIVTTRANKDMASIHDRMPVILQPQDESRWLDPDKQRPEDIADLFNPYSQPLEIHQVSQDVNSTRNRGKSLIDPTD